MIRFKMLDVDYVPTKQQLADQLTKALTPKTHWSLARHILGERIPHDWYHDDTAQQVARSKDVTLVAQAESEGGYHETPKDSSSKSKKGALVSQTFG